MINRIAMEYSIYLTYEEFEILNYIRKLTFSPKFTNLMLSFDTWTHRWTVH